MQKNIPSRFSETSQHLTRWFNSFHLTSEFFKNKTLPNNFYIYIYIYIYMYVYIYIYILLYVYIYCIVYFLYSIGEKLNKDKIGL